MSKKNSAVSIADCGKFYLTFNWNPYIIIFQGLTEFFKSFFFKKWTVSTPYRRRLWRLKVIKRKNLVFFARY